MSKKSLFNLILLVGIVFVSGCTQLQEPNIKSIQPKSPFVSAGENAEFLIEAANPTRLNFNGNLLLQAELPECFDIGFSRILPNTRGLDGTISIEAGKSSTALMLVRVPSTLSSECYTKYKLTFFLLQNATVLDSESLDFTLVRR